MIFNTSLYAQFQELGLSEYADSLDEYISSTFLTPNDLNCNPISLDYIRSRSTYLNLILSKLEPTDITSDLEDLFLSLFNRQDIALSKPLILASKTKFLQFICGAFVYGLLKEVQEFPDLKRRNFTFF